VTRGPPPPHPHPCRCIAAFSRQLRKIDELRRRPDCLTERNGVVAAFSIKLIAPVQLPPPLADRANHPGIFAPRVYRSDVNPQYGGLHPVAHLRRTIRLCSISLANIDSACLIPNARSRIWIFRSCPKLDALDARKDRVRRAL